MTLVIVLPRPPAALSPNARQTRMAQAARASEYRGECALLIAEQVRAQRWLAPEFVRLSIEYGIGPKTLQEKIRQVGPARPRDVDNAVAACKAAIDALQDGRAILGDDYKCLELGSVRIQPKGTELRFVIEAIACID